MQGESLHILSAILSVAHIIKLTEFKMVHCWDCRPCNSIYIYCAPAEDVWLFRQRFQFNFVCLFDLFLKILTPNALWSCRIVYKSNFQTEWQIKLHSMYVTSFQYEAQILARNNNIIAQRSLLYNFAGAGQQVSQLPHEHEIKLQPALK